MAVSLDNKWIRSDWFIYLATHILKLDDRAEERRVKRRAYRF